MNLPAIVYIMEKSLSSVSASGTHVICDMYGVDETLLDNERILVGLIKDSAKHAGATVLDVTSHKFSPQGVTALALLAESHVSIHTWPEQNYAAIDIFTCGTMMQPDQCIDVIIEKLKPSSIDRKKLSRGIR